MRKINQNAKEHTIETFLNKYRTYQIGMKNCKQQLNYMLPSLTVKFTSDGKTATYHIKNNAEEVALDRIISKKAIDLTEEMARYKLIIASIDNAMGELDEKQKQFVELRYFDGLKMYEVKAKMNVSEEKTLYRIRRQVLDRFVISLSSLMTLK